MKMGHHPPQLKILDKVIKIPDFREWVHLVFNDIEYEYATTLRQNLYSYEGIQELKYHPEVYNYNVGSKLLEIVERYRNIPSFSFIDPFGYKGIDLDLIRFSIESWGSDCLLFFNYNRINSHLNNPVKGIIKNMAKIFGEDRIEYIRKKAILLKSKKREEFVLSQFNTTLNQTLNVYTQPYRFAFDDRNKTSHFLIYLTKNQFAHSVIKQVMANESPFDVYGVPSFEYNPNIKSKENPLQLSLFKDDKSPLDELEEMILKDFSGEVITFHELYIQHNYGKKYILQNYKSAILNLENKGKIVCHPPAKERKKGTLRKDSIIVFPQKSIS